MKETLLGKILFDFVQLHCTMFDGDGHVQIAEDAAVEQRPCVLLPVPNSTRPQVHPLCQRPPQRPQAFQPPPQHHL